MGSAAVFACYSHELKNRLFLSDDILAIPQHRNSAFSEIRAGRSILSASAVVRPFSSRKASHLGFQSVVDLAVIEINLRGLYWHPTTARLGVVKELAIGLLDFVSPVSLGGGHLLSPFVDLNIFNAHRAVNHYFQQAVI